MIALGLILFVITFIVLAIARYQLLRLIERMAMVELAHQYPALCKPPPPQPRRDAAAYCATAFGPSWFVLILPVLLWEGFGGLSLAVFTEMTPPPGSAGGLLNAIAGSLI